eukprot:5920784-Prymnesium_polylepis.1
MALGCGHPVMLMRSHSPLPKGEMLCRPNVNDGLWPVLSVEKSSRDLDLLNKPCFALLSKAPGVPPTTWSTTPADCPLPKGEMLCRPNVNVKDEQLTWSVRSV